MLILNRKTQERIIIGDGETAITITIVRIRGDRVQIGVTAPKDTPVHREEVYALLTQQAVGGAN